MRPNHFFLVIFDATTNDPAVEDVGTDATRAIAALNDKERELAGSACHVVMLGAESLEALKRSHSSYFGTASLPTAA